MVTQAAPQERRRGLWIVVSAALLAVCGKSASDPTPPPTPPTTQDSWYTGIVQCANCPGLTNAEIDRTVTPHRARLRVGQLTSLRSVVRDGCEAYPAMLEIVGWVPADPSVLKVVSSSTESAIVTALAPGISAITAERKLSGGNLIRQDLKDPQITSGCSSLPDVVFEIIP
jgi:hypothetical protein